VAAAAGWFPDRDAVADGYLAGSDEDVLDEGAQDALAVLGGGGGRVLAEAGEEAFESVGEPEVGVAVGGLSVEGGDLVFQAGFAGAEVWHAGAELVDGDELLGERGDQRGDGRGGLRERLPELAALAGDRVRRARPLEPLIDLGADEGRVGEQAGDVVPDDFAGVVGADGLVLADAAVLVAVVVGAEAPVVVDLPGRGAGGGAVVAVASRCCTRSKVSSSMRAGTGISVHSSRGRSVTLTCRGTVRPWRRAVRFSPAGSWTARVLPKTARPQ
jgi:hypothetical protein